MAIKKKTYKNIYDYSPESNINDEYHNTFMVSYDRKEKRFRQCFVIDKKSEEYKIISKEVSRQISKDDCRILNFLKRKEQKESKKYLSDKSGLSKDLEKIDNK